jgi:prepilin-type N-terminal cleavage/methylation domain-containing protein
MNKIFKGGNLKMKKVLKNKKAFTLTEMIVVIAIIGILAGVLIPTITGYIKRANQSAAYQEAEAVLNIYETWQTEAEAGLSSKYFSEYYKEVFEEDVIAPLTVLFTYVVLRIIYFIISTRDLAQEQ